mmetsp:Transcript_2973/g.4168  ORF Transcript_2973/g.4168 Transcript_2973/m.4168 type:complete len:158 (-) Transcript_2973:967-1440(-)
MLKLLDMPAKIAWEVNPKGVQTIFSVKTPGKILVWAIEAAKKVLGDHNLVSEDSHSEHDVSSPSISIPDKVLVEEAGGQDRLTLLFKVASTVTNKAVKADDAAVPVGMWDCRALSFWANQSDAEVLLKRSVLDIFRNWLLKVWRRRITSEVWSVWNQ